MVVPNDRHHLSRIKNLVGTYLPIVYRQVLDIPGRLISARLEL